MYHKPKFILMLIYLKNQWRVVLFWLIILILLALAGCKPSKQLSAKTYITTTQLHTVTRIDTIGRDVRIFIAPAGMPKSSMKNGIKVGDTIRVLRDTQIRY